MKQRATGLLAGLILITIGVAVHNKLTVYLSFFGTETNPLSILLMAMGAIVFVIGFFGCCGAYKRNYCLMMTFAVLLAFIMAAEIAGALTAFFLQTELELYIVNDMLMTMHMYNRSEAIRTAWDTAQREFSCCGVTDFRNWEVVFNDSTSSLPDSCCVEERPRNSCKREFLNQHNDTQTDVYSNIYAQSCAEAVGKWLSDNLSIIVLLCVALAAVQFTGIILTCSLARKIRLESGIS